MIPDRLFVLGYEGSPRAEVGRVLADRLDRPFFVLDEVIEASARMPLVEVLRREGDSGFRQRQRRALVAVATGPPAVCVLGTRTFLDRGNRRTMEQAGVSVFVDASLEECIAGAIEKGSLRADPEGHETFINRYETFRKEYEQADVVVETLGRTPDEIADEVLQRLEDRVWTEKLR